MPYPINLEGFNLPESQVAEIQRIIDARVYGPSPEDDSVVSGSVGTRILGARVVNSAGGLGNTFHVMARLATQFDAIRLVLMNPTVADVVNVTGAITPGGSTADSLQSGATWTPVTWAGGANVTLPLAADAQNPNIVLSDWIPCKGDSSKLISVRVYVPAAGNTTCPVTSVVAGIAATWATMANREWISRYQAGDFVTTPASMNTTTLQDVNAIVGIQYIARGVVYTVMGIGDSGIGQGDSASPEGRGDSFWSKACKDLLAEGYPVEIANCGWAGQTTAQIFTRAQTLLNSIKPQIVVYGLFSPNDGAPSDATDLAMRGRAARIRDIVKLAGAQLVGIPGIPRAASSSSSNWTQAQDARRKLFNAELVRTLPLFSDIDAVVANTQNSGTASYFLPGMSDDFIHLTNYGHIIASVPTKFALQQLIR